MPRRRNVESSDKIWLRQARETSKAWRAFQLYLEMGPDRSYAKVCKALGKRRGYAAQLERWAGGRKLCTGDPQPVSDDTVKNVYTPQVTVNKVDTSETSTDLVVKSGPTVNEVDSAPEVRSESPTVKSVGTQWEIRPWRERVRAYEDWVTARDAIKMRQEEIDERRKVRKLRRASSLKVLQLAATALDHKKAEDSSFNELSRAIARAVDALQGEYEDTPKQTVELDFRAAVEQAAQRAQELRQLRLRELGIEEHVTIDVDAVDAELAKADQEGEEGEE